MLDIKAVKDEAIKEITEEKMKKAKEAVKQKLRELDKARQVVTNIERELNELYVTIGAGIN